MQKVLSFFVVASLAIPLTFAATGSPIGSPTSPATPTNAAPVATPQSGVAL